MRECIEFTLDLFNDEQLYHRPCRISLHEASVTLSEIVEENALDIPDTLSPRRFMEIWNSFCDAIDT